jgi:hypothetical protein
MHKVHIDLTGQHVRSRNGFTFLMTAIDYFSKFLVAVPMRNKTAEVVADAIVKHVYLVFGCCEIQVTDQGGEFQNLIMQNITKTLGIHRMRITALGRKETRRSKEFIEL